MNDQILLAGSRSFVALRLRTEGSGIGEDGSEYTLKKNILNQDVWASNSGDLFVEVSTSAFLKRPKELLDKYGYFLAYCRKHHKLFYKRNRCEDCIKGEN